jgi:hypothetical protein
LHKPAAGDRERARLRPARNVLQADVLDELSFRHLSIVSASPRRGVQEVHTDEVHTDRATSAVL